MLDGREVARVLDEFENERDWMNDVNSLYHMDTTSMQTRLKRNVQDLLTSFDELGNPFEEQSGDLTSRQAKQ